MSGNVPHYKCVDCTIVYCSGVQRPASETDIGRNDQDTIFGPLLSPHPLCLGPDCPGPGWLAGQEVPQRTGDHFEEL